MKPFYRRSLADTNRDPQKNKTYLLQINNTFCGALVHPPYCFAQQLPVLFQRFPSQMLDSTSTLLIDVHVLQPCHLKVEDVKVCAHGVRSKVYNQKI